MLACRVAAEIEASRRGGEAVLGLALLEAACGWGGLLCCVDSGQQVTRREGGRQQAAGTQVACCLSSHLFRISRR